MKVRARERQSPFEPSGAARYDERRLRRLMKATDHIAPRYSLGALTRSLRLRDAIAVVRLWSKGLDVRLLSGDLLRRLATNGYGKRLRLYPRAPKGAAVLLALLLLHTSALAAGHDSKTTLAGTISCTVRVRLPLLTSDS